MELNFTPSEFGLIGYPLVRSFSPFIYRQLAIADGLMRIPDYQMWPVRDIHKWVSANKENRNLAAFNVTTPYKQKIVSYLDKLAGVAEEIAQVNNVVCLENGNWIGYNTDVTGFENSLVSLDLPEKGLSIICGTGGAARAARFVLTSKGWDVHLVSRNKQDDILSYEEVNQTLAGQVDMIVQATPLGNYPFENQTPDLPYNLFKSTTFFYDLNCNYQKSLFLEIGGKKGCPTMDGYKMLYAQAVANWKLWKSCFPVITQE